MKTVKLNFTVPGEIASSFKSRVSKGSRSAFVASAVLEKLNQLEREQLRQALVEGYLARRDEDAETNREWENSTLEGWR